MAKILLITIAFIILALVVVAMYRAIIVAGRSCEDENNCDINEGDDKNVLE